MSTAPVISHRMTWAEFLALPDEPRYRHAELVDGELVLVNPPTWLQQRAVTRLIHHLMMWCDAAPDRGEVTADPPVQISAARGYLPDVAWYAAGRDRPAAGSPYLSGAPDLAVEVLSPSTRTIDMIRKRTDYARAGVRELWLIDPEEPIAVVLRRDDERAEPAEFVLVAELKAEDVLSSPLLPGLEIAVSALAQPS